MAASQQDSSGLCVACGRISEAGWNTVEDLSTVNKQGVKKKMRAAGELIYEWANCGMYCNGPLCPRCRTGDSARSHESECMPLLSEDGSLDCKHDGSDVSPAASSTGSYTGVTEQEEDPTPLLTFGNSDGLTDSQLSEIVGSSESLSPNGLVGQRQNGQLYENADIGDVMPAQTARHVSNSTLYPSKPISSREAFELYLRTLHCLANLVFKKSDRPRRNGAALSNTSRRSSDTKDPAFLYFAEVADTFMSEFGTYGDLHKAKGKLPISGDKSARLRHYKKFLLGKCTFSMSGSVQVSCAVGTCYSGIEHEEFKKPAIAARQLALTAPSLPTVPPAKKKRGSDTLFFGHVSTRGREDVIEARRKHATSDSAPPAPQPRRSKRTLTTTTQLPPPSPPPSPPPKTQAEHVEEDLSHFYTEYNSVFCKQEFSPVVPCIGVCGKGHVFPIPRTSIPATDHDSNNPHRTPPIITHLLVPVADRPAATDYDDAGTTHTSFHTSPPVTGPPSGPSAPSRPAATTTAANSTELSPRAYRLRVRQLKVQIAKAKSAFKYHSELALIHEQELSELELMLRTDYPDSRTPTHPLATAAPLA